MPAEGEQVANDSVDGEEPLGVRHRLEAAHVGFALPRGLMRDLGPVVGVASGIVDDGRHDDAVRRAVADEAIDDEAARNLGLLSQ
jgi:hypothetical protein